MWSTRWSESLLNISDYDWEERRERSPGPVLHQWGFVPSPWSHIAQLSPERAVETHTFRGALLWFVWVQMKKQDKVKQTLKQHVNWTQSALLLAKNDMAPGCCDTTLSHNKFWNVLLYTYLLSPLFNISFCGKVLQTNLLPSKLQQYGVSVRGAFESCTSCSVAGIVCLLSSDVVE